MARGDESGQLTNESFVRVTSENVTSTTVEATIVTYVQIKYITCCLYVCLGHRRCHAKDLSRRNSLASRQTDNKLSE